MTTPFMQELRRRNAARCADLGDEVDVATAEDLESLSERVTALEGRVASMKPASKAAAPLKPQPASLALASLRKLADRVYGRQ